MSRVIRYTYNANSEPADPDENSTLYTNPIAYQAGYYKAKAWEGSDVSDVVSNSFERFPNATRQYLFINGSLFDTGTSRQDITKVGNPDMVTGVKTSDINGAYYLQSPSGKYFTLDTHSDFNIGDNYSISLWIKIFSSGRYAVFCSQTDLWFGFDIQDLGGLKFCLWASSNGSGWNMINSDGGGNGRGSITLPYNQWNHCVFVKQGTSYKTYINNVLDLNLTVGGIIVDRSTQYKKIGLWGNDSFGSVYYLDNFQIWKDVALSIEEVYELYTNEKDV